MSGPVAIFVPTESDLLTAEFYLDDPQMRQGVDGFDILKPFDFGGTKPNGQANLKTFTKGPHTLTTRLVYSDGYVDVISAAFTVT